MQYVYISFAAMREFRIDVDFEYVSNCQSASPPAIEKEHLLSLSLYFDNFCPLNGMIALNSRCEIY